MKSSTVKGKGKGSRGPYEKKKSGVPACNPCQKAKARCVGEPICERCQQRGEYCIRGEDGRSQLVTKFRIQSYEEKIKGLEIEVAQYKSRLLKYEQNGTQPDSVKNSPDPSEQRLNTVIDRLKLSTGSHSEGGDTDCRDPAQSESDDDEESSSSDSESDDYCVETGSFFKRRSMAASANVIDLNELNITAVFRLRLRKTPSQRALRRLHKLGMEPRSDRRHILQLSDTAVQSLCDCKPEDECWRRCLPQDLPLTRTEHDILLDRCFCFFSPWCMRIIPEYFLRDMYYFHHPPNSQAGPSPSGSSAPAVPPPYRPRTTHYSPFLHLAVLAVASAFSDNPVISAPSARARFAEEAKKLIEDECKVPNIAAVQALGMLGSYYSGTGQQNLGFLYAGMGARVGQALGLSTDCSQWVESGRIKPQEMLDRLWCYHMVSANDACWSLYVGREFGVPSYTLDPLALSDLAQPLSDSLNTMRWRQSSTSTTSLNDPENSVVESPGNAKEVEAQTCNTFTIFLWGCRLMKISRRIMTLMSILGSGSGGHEVIRFVADVDIQIISWYEELPPELRVNLKRQKDVAALPALLMMHLSFRWLLILLHRPFFKRQSGPDHDFYYKRCTVAAREILVLISIWRRLYGPGSLRFSPITLVQTVFAAGTVYLLTAQHAATGRAPAPQAHKESMNGVEEVVEILREVGASWGSARRIVKVFEGLIDAQKKLVERGPRAIRNGKASRANTNGQVKRRKKMDADRVPAVRVDDAQAQQPHSSSQSSGSQDATMYDNHLLLPTQLNPPHTRSLDRGYSSAPEVEGHGNAEQHLIVPGATNGSHPPTWSDNEHSDTGEVETGDHDANMLDVQFWRFLQSTLAPNPSYTHDYHAQIHHAHGSDAGQPSFSQTSPVIGSSFSHAPTSPASYSMTLSPPMNDAAGNSLSGWNFTGTGLGMENGRSFAEAPFMAFDTWTANFSNLAGMQQFNQGFGNDPFYGDAQYGVASGSGYGYAQSNGYRSDVPIASGSGQDPNNSRVRSASNATDVDGDVNFEGVDQDDKQLWGVITSLYHGAATPRAAR